MFHSFLFSYKDVFIRLTVFRFEEIKWVILIVGWVYFAAWSLSFYPQTYENFKNKSVVGFNFDYVAFNLIGHFSYLVFNAGLFWDSSLMHIYFTKHPHGVNPVQLNDALFSIHAVFATLCQIFQCFIYKTGGQRVSIPCICISSALILFELIGLILSDIVTGVISNLTYLYYFSYVKLGITLIKYVPQAYSNFKRKSTKGWSIGYVMLDILGGSMSIFQMLLISYNYDDWGSLIGDVGKLGLGAFSIVFDILFIIQHYILYRPKSRSVSKRSMLKGSSLDFNSYGGSVTHM